MSGHYPRPIIGRQQVVAEDTATANADDAPIKHPVLKTRPQRVEVSKSGDMAYRFALFDMEFDRPDSAGKTEHMKFEGSQLTVCARLVANGGWRPHSTDPTSSISRSGRRRTQPQPAQLSESDVLGGSSPLPRRCGPKD